MILFDFTSQKAIHKISLWQWLCYGALAISLILSILHLPKADLFYETDISRDFLLLDDMVESKKISLIGGRSSIPGVFHGPLYYWMALPFFVISDGSPVVVSYLWILLYIAFLAAFYFICRKVTDYKFALISTTFIATITTNLPKGFTHTVLANFLILPLIYFVYRYTRERKIWLLALSIFTVGIIIQFQMAFGVPVLILLGIFTLYQVIKYKNFTHLFAYFIILIPLSTFILFDIRHDFIQIKSVISYFSTKPPNDDWTVMKYLIERIKSIIDSFNILSLPYKNVRDLVSIFVFLTLMYLPLKTIKKKNKIQSTFGLCLLIIFGYWIVTIPFKGTVWGQYYKPLQPLIIFCFTYALLNYFPKKIGRFILITIIALNLMFNIKTGINYWQTTATDDEVHWKFYRKMAQDIFIDSNNQKFGYFIFSPDQYGYQAKYAMRYFSKESDNQSIPYQKQQTTYLIFAPNFTNNPLVDANSWQADKVRIYKEPSHIWTYPAGYSVKRFNLDTNDLMIKADENLIEGIHFR